MDSDSIYQILIMLVLIMFSAFFSATETAFTSLNRISIKTLAEDGNKKAQKVVALSTNYDKLLSTILVGNNIVNISLSSIATIFFITNISKDLGATLSTIVTTILVLLFGEITPKNLAKENAESYAMTVAPIISVFIIIFTPLNFAFSAWQKLVSKLFKSKKVNSATENEILTLIDEAEQIGEFDSDESELIRSAIEFNDVEAIDIFTPRVDIVSIEYGATNSEIAKTFAKSGFSRLPVYKENVDNIIGVITEKDFYNQIYNRSTPVEQIIKEPLFITGSMKISALLSQLQKTKQHIAVISDEYGGTKGIVTMEDILEELVGEIWDEHDDIVNEIVKVEDNVFLIRCNMDFEEFCENFGLEVETEVNSVGGWVMEQLGKIPEVNDTYNYENLNVIVTKTDERRVSEIKITVTQPVKEDNE